jgi:hypothetical protein
MITVGLVSFALAAAMPADAAADERARAIDRFCRPLEALAQDRHRARHFGLYVWDGQLPGRWREHQGGIARDTLHGKTWDVARVWSRPDGARAVKWILDTSTGDWGHQTVLCYRPNGSLAKSDSLLSTFHGGVNRRRTRYFDMTGRQIKKTSSLRDLGTGRPVHREFSDQDEPLFKTTRALPFAKLLPRPAGR